MTNNKSRLSVVRKSSPRQPLAQSWVYSSAHHTELNLHDMDLLRSWAILDSDLRADLAQGHLNWNMILGLALATAVSASIWTGVGLVIASLWK